MNDDIYLQLLTLFALVLVIGLPIVFKRHLKTCLTISFTSMILGLLSFMFLLIIQTSSGIGIYGFYVSMFLWMFGLILGIQTSIQRSRHLNKRNLKK